MIFTVDYEHIFFDRYMLDECKKKKEARMLICRVFKDSAKFLEADEMRIEIAARDVEEEVCLANNIRLLKREFFLRVDPFEETAPVEEKEEDIVDIAEKYIRKRYLYEAFSASDVCEYCNVNRKKLDKAFENRFSKSVSEYIKSVRVEKATDLIYDGEKLEEVADFCGFGSLKTMQRAFKSVRGKTPSEYRPCRLDSQGTK